MGAGARGAGRLSRAARRLDPAAWRDPRHRRGLAAEREAIGYLMSLGGAVEAHRFRAGRHEVDVVVRFGRTVAFVEVKHRRVPTAGTGAEAVHWRKRRAIGRVAEAWRLRHGRAGDTYRFDVVAIEEWRRGPDRLSHTRDAWRL